MPRTDNYPDNIRQFDNDPRSPFFNDPDYELCSKCDKEFNFGELDEHFDDDKLICSSCLEELESENEK